MGVWRRLRGWWGNPWVFESPRRHDREIERGVRLIAGLPVFGRAHAEGGTRTGEGRRPDREEKPDLAEGASPSPSRGAKARTPEHDRSSPRRTRTGTGPPTPGRNSLPGIPSISFVLSGTDEQEEKRAWMRAAGGRPGWSERTGRARSGGESPLRHHRNTQWVLTLPTSG